ncbi:uncharacterized protein [Littorina saxatilis]|uniref:Uncharacterized protein n=1 Tax=Littorina saxatilis TaxID=31220 RepID=A0AAN9C290_9CAEN
MFQLKLKPVCCGTSAWDRPKQCASLITLLLGCCMLVFLHVLISSEFEDEAAYFSSLSLPEEDSKLPQMGIVLMENLPVTGTPRMPKRIHQTWKSDEIPHSLTEWVKSWTKNHPDWEYWLWTDKSARHLISDRHPSFLQTYDNYPHNIQRADALRYIVLYEFGGVYADLDMESLRPLDRLAWKYSCFLGQEPYAHPILDTNTHTLVINAIMACQPGHPFMKMVVDSLPDFAHMWSLFDATGPHFLSYVYKKYMRENQQLSPTHEDWVYLTPAEYFYPNRDPDKFSYFYRQCKNYEQLNPLQRAACHNLKKTPLEEKRMALAFTNHHWVHTYLFSVKVSLRQPVPMREIVPEMKLYPEDAPVK